MQTTNLNDSAKCPTCGQPLPAGALAGLCPACLMAQGLETDAGSGDANKTRFTPPTLQSLAKLFPQLEILGMLGAGGMGAVYKARQPALDRLVALKVLPAGGTDGGNFAERFNREARALARLNHPNIVAVYEFGHVESLHFFLMEYVDGANLRQLEKAGRLAPREALQLIPQICDALQYAHDEGVVHRDIKPENVLVDRKGRVKIADFGLAKILGQDVESLRLTNEGQVMGTPHYMAPEQVARPLAVDHRADIYSLGVVLYEMLTGELPLGKFSPPSRKVQVDVRFDDVVLRALENDPERRYQHASEVKTQVETIAGGAATATAPASSPLPSGPQKIYWAGIPVVVEQNGHRKVSFSGVLLAIAAAIGLLIASWLFLAFTTDNPHSNFFIPALAAMAIIIAGVRYTLRQPLLSTLPRTPQGTVILPPKRPWWRNGHYYALGSITAFSVIWNVAVEHTFLFQKMFPRPLPVPAQVMQNNSGPMRINLPGGGTVELIAIGKAGDAPNQWWQPDGTPLTNAYYELHNPSLPHRLGTTPRNVIVHWNNTGPNTDGPWVQCASADTSGAGGKILTQGEMMSDASQASFTWNNKTPTEANILVGFALDSWSNLGTPLDLQHSNIMFQKTDGAPKKQFFLHSATESLTGIHLAMGIPPEDPNERVRIVAIDVEGKQHIASNSTTSGLSDAPVLSCDFPDLSLKKLKGFDIQTRKVHWIEFRNVAMEPKAPLPTAKPLEFFGEFQIGLNNLELFDIDTFTGLGLDPGNRQNHSVEEWAKLKQADLSVDKNEVHIHNMTLAMVKDDEWNTLTPQEVIDRVYQGRFAPRILKPMNADGSGATFAYQTRENGFGLLQFVKTDSASTGVTLRFKRVERPRKSDFSDNQP